MIHAQERKILMIKSIVILLLILLVFLLYYKYSFSKINPLFYIKGPDNIKLEVNTEFKDPGYVAKLNDIDLHDNVKVKSDVDTKKVGNYEINYSVYLKYLNIRKELTRKVSVVDTTAPELKVDGDKEISLYVNDSYEKPTATAKDNYDGDLTDKIKVFSNLQISSPGDYEITYSVKDSSNNETTDKIVVRVKEKEIPKENIYNPRTDSSPVTNAYIDVSISAQKLNYYENGQLVLSSDIVTGINDGTPTGDYSILYKARNVTLKGANYTSFVNYWMAFIGHSYGIHDASWRSTFGGEIYKYNGSHGCINMPYSSVSQLYEIVQEGTPVHVRY